MSQVLNQEISKTKEKSYLREIDDLLSKLKANCKSMKTENKEIVRLRKLNDKSFEKLKQTVESLQSY